MGSQRVRQNLATEQQKKKKSLPGLHKKSVIQDKFIHTHAKSQIKLEIGIQEEEEYMCVYACKIVFK